MKAGYKAFLSFIAAACAAFAAQAAVKTVELGNMPGGELRRAVAKAVAEKAPADTLVIRLLAEQYDFHPADAEHRQLYISNHDQDNPKAVGILIENARNVILDGGNARLLFNGRMLPVALLNSSGCRLRGFSIDFPNPQISQVIVESNDTAAGVITYRPEPWVEWEVRDSAFVVKGEGWEHTPLTAIPFEEHTGRVLYRSGDINVGVKGVTRVSPTSVSAPWKDPRLLPGTRLAMRTYRRPAPGIFLDADTATTIENVLVHYAEGMGLLAQNCRDIDIRHSGVCRSSYDDPRFFTTQADATHFSSCSGNVAVTDCLFEGMMDDAINVHGTYLKITEVIDSATISARYMHRQTYGFPWGAPGDTVRLVSSSTMDYLAAPSTINTIRPLSPQSRDFIVTLSSPLPDSLLRFLSPTSARLSGEASFSERPSPSPLPAVGIENLTRTPAVIFARNTVRHNRARGALFSSPRPTICEDNLFDHTSGAAILLCGDCNGWYESGPCRDVTIRRNTFLNALTTPYQFTEAVISVYPVIPDLDHKRAPFHSGVTISGNRFITFGTPLLYAKSAAGLRFLDNTIETDTAYPPYHPASTPPIRLIACPDPEIQPCRISELKAK